MYMTLRCTWWLFSVLIKYSQSDAIWVSSFNILGPQPSSEEVVRTHFAELSCLFSDFANRLALAPELFSAHLITQECYNSATDNCPKTDRKGLLLMKGLTSTIKNQPQLLTKKFRGHLILIQSLMNLKQEWVIMERSELEDHCIKFLRACIDEWSVIIKAARVLLKDWKEVVMELSMD